MTNILKNLQTKPESVKKVIMWFGIVFIMAAIFTFWLITFPSQIPASENSPATDNLNKELPGIWQTLKEQINSLENLWQK